MNPSGFYVDPNEFYAGRPNSDRTSPISDNLYPLTDFVCRGYELGYELCLLGAKRCTLRQTQGDKKKSHKSLNLWDLSAYCPVLSS